MNRMLNIIRDEFKRLSSSVVAIVIVMGICIVPCLYAWFNIFSNWDPYAPTGTSRIAVAVANEDKGAELLGLNINVGEKITEELEANTDLGWTIVGSEDRALEGLYSGEYYAAVVIPESFSSDTLSFTTGDLVHPELDYYENEKKNAIAPKITNAAQKVLKEEVDAAFIETIGTYLSEAETVAEASGLDPEDVFEDLGERIGLLGDRMDDLVAIVTAAEGLSDAADELMKASDSLAGSTQDSLETGQKVLKEEEKLLPKTEADAKKVSSSVKKEADVIANGLDKLYTSLSAVAGDMDAFNDFVVKDLEARKKLVNDMAVSARDVAQRLSQLGLEGLAARFNKLADHLTEIYQKLDALEVADETTWPQIQKQINGLLKDIKAAEDTARSISEDAGSKMDDKINKAIKDTKNTIHELRTSLNEAYGDLDTLSSSLAKAEASLKTMDGGLNLSVSALLDLQNGFDSLSELFDSMADSDAMKNINYLLSDGTEVIAENLASPIKMKTETVYPVRNFGSVMASFYTVLAQWVGALLAAVLIRVRRRGDRDLRELSGPELRRTFFDRSVVFLLFGLIEALIVSLGDLLYVGIQCEHPVMFVLAACVNGIVFMMINYALVFMLDRVGLAVAVIVLLMQVAGSGGTYPPEVLPGIFQKLYPFMPFHYAMNAMRECIAGTYGHTYLTCLGLLLLFGAVAAVLGLLLVKPFEWISQAFRRGMENSDLMES